MHVKYIYIYIYVCMLDKWWSIIVVDSLVINNKVSLEIGY